MCARYSRYRALPTGPRISASIISEKPMMALSGVRNSWLMRAVRSDHVSKPAAAECRSTRDRFGGRDAPARLDSGAEAGIASHDASLMAAADPHTVDPPTSHRRVGIHASVIIASPDSMAARPAA